MKVTRRGEISFAQLIRANNHLPLRIFFIFFVSLLFSLEARPQSPGSREAAPGQRQEFVREINGTVIDAVTKEPLLGVSLVIYVDSVKYVGRASRDGGRFDFRGTHITHGVMKINHEGYIAQEIQLSPQNNGPYHIALQPDAIAIEEVEVISTG
ncbi:carboxypeptidase-like regulatory domain-containing protein, partial [Parapusillimonas sp. SGNA-6]|nr:carboxypeptidase-like regulatory domain-containing protein [Parapusillimonas sp. SGNA-6]